MNLSSKRQTLNYWVIAGTILVLWLITTRIQEQAIVSSLDPAYKLIANIYSTGNIYGHNLFFNYGPMAYLGFPQNIGSNVIWGSLAYWLCRSLYFLTLIALIFRLHRNERIAKIILLYLPIAILIFMWTLLLSILSKIIA